MKLKKLSLVLSLLAFVALTSVGFAAWLITGDAEETLEGSIQVEEVIDRRVNATIKATEEEGVAPTIVFGKPETFDAKNAWLIPDSSAVEESLEFNITIVISKVDVLKSNSSSFTIEGTVAEHEENAVWEEGSDPEVTVYEHLKSQGLVGALPTISTITFSKDAETQEWSYNTPDGYKITEDNTAKTITITIPVKFSWGTKYNSVNPFAYYNATGKTAAADGDAALADLQALYRLNGQKYVATITISAE